MADDLIRKSDVLETYADLYDIFDDNKTIQEELHKVFDKINNIPSVESNCSGKPNNCETCKHYKLTCDLFSEICKYEPKTKPTISKMEQVDEPQISPSDCKTCKHDLWSTPRTCGKCSRQKDGKPSMYEPKDESQTERYGKE